MTAAIARTIDTPDGPFTLIETSDGVIASGWTENVDELLSHVHESIRPAEVQSASAQPGESAAADAVLAYYASEVHAIDDVPVHAVTTDFHTAARRAMRAIAPGKPVTYAEFAVLAGRPDAVRASASVCATNPTALFVPCHRVVRTDGGLGGFLWGTDVKRSLLDREAAATVGTTASA